MSLKAFSRLGFLSALSLLFFAQNAANGQTNLYSAASNNYSAANTWYSDAARTTLFPGTVGSTHILNIGNGHTITIQGGTTLTVSGIVVHDAGASGTLVIGNGTNSTSTITVTNDITVNTAGTLQIGTNTNSTNTLSAGGNVTINGAGVFRNGGDGGATNNVTLAGNVTNNGTFNLAFSADVSTLTSGGSGTKTFTGTSATTATLYNLTISSGNVVFGDNNVTARTININNDLVFSGGTLGSGTTGAAAHTINLTRNFTNNGATVNMTTNSATNHTLNFVGAGAKVLAGSSAITATLNNLVITNGTVDFGNTAAARTLNISNDLTLLGGILESGSTGSAAHRINLTRNLTNSGGSINMIANSASAHTFSFQGTGSKTIAGTSTATATFNNLNVTTETVTFGDNANGRTINVAGTISLTTGGVFQSGNTGSVAHTINLTGNLTNISGTGTFDLTANSATNQTLTFTGAGAKTISASAGSATFKFYNVVMNTGSSANVNVNNDIVITGAVSWLQNGLFVVGTNNVTLGSAASIASPSTTRYFQLDGTADVNSQLIRTSDGTVAGWLFLFPIGTSTGGYTPLDLTNAGTTITTAPTLNSTLAVKAINSSSYVGRLRRTFRMIVAGNSNATTFTGGRFNYVASDVSFSESLASYNNFWYQKESNGVWTSPGGTAPGAGNVFIGPSSPQPLTNDTYFFTIGTPNAYGVTWYSYQTGNWSSPTTWTTDGSVFPLLVNPTNAIPSIADNVIITSGRTVSMDINNVAISSVVVTGTLDVVGTTGHNFNVISGAGRIKIAGATDNFPAGTATNFADNTVGGILEVNGSGILLNAARSFNNVVINLDNSSSTATLFNDITVNGSFSVLTGIFAFNDNSSTTNRTLTVRGNALVDVNGAIRTGTGNARHEFNLYGDFTNNATAYFTNRTSAVTGSEATDGIVDLNLLSSSADQDVACNGVTRFYRLEINKGTDATYIATIEASAPGNFNLFGFANQNIDSSAGTNDNALGLIAGTAQLGTNVSVLLNTTGNYAIYQAARLWVNGASVTKTGGNAVVPYGTFRITSGSLTANTIDSGLTLRGSGIILIEGGTVTLRAIRTSVNGANAVGSYIQSGGTVVLEGGTVESDYAVFSLTYPNNVFNMSGGTLTIQNRVSLGTGSARGAIFINSDPANVNVTGGTVTLDANNGINYRITSRAPFWNLNLKGTGATRTVELIGTTSGQGTAGVDQLTLTNQSLVVLNDFSIQDNASFATNNADVTVGGNFEVQNLGTYTSGTNTTTISGAGVSSLIFTNTSSTQAFNNFTIAKTAATDEVVITTGNATAMRVNGTLTVSKGIFNYATFIASARGTVTLGSGVVVGKNTGTGRLLLDGSGSPQVLNSSLATIHNLELNNTSGATLATGDLTILKALTLTTGVFNIGTFKLTINGAAASIAGAPYGITKMIQTAANASDGGLVMYVDANEVLTFPIGVSGKYTPVVATITAYVDDGLIKIAPVNGILQTTVLSGGADILAYYWRVGSSNFSPKPNVSYQFTYVDNTPGNDVGGTETVYVPGKVLDNAPFTRSFENSVAKVDETNNTITFNGSGAGFGLEDANYTAGTPGRFDNSTPVRVYYTRQLTDAYSQSWADGNLWTLGGNASFGKHDSRQNPAGASPGIGDIAVIGWVPFGDPNYTNGYPHGVELSTTQQVAEVRFTQMLNISNNPTTRVFFRNFQFRPTLCLNNNGGGNQGQLANGTKVSGEGMFWNRSTGGNLSDPTFAGVDLGAFNAQDSSYVVYESTLASATYNNMPSTFPNLIMSTDGWGANDNSSTITNTITVNGNLELLGDINLLLNTGATGDITVNRNLRLFRANDLTNDSGDGAELRFGNSGTPRTVNILGNLILGNGGFGSGFVIRIGSPDGSPITHTINLYGNFVQNTSGNNTGATPNGNGFKGGNDSASDRIHLNLLGTNSMTLTNVLGDAPQFYSLTVDKGSSIATTAAFNSNFSIDGPSNAATKSLVLRNGLFIINHASANVVLTSGGGDFNIPGTAGLEIAAGTVRTTTTNTLANITLDGLLRVSGGTATIDSGSGFANYIEYSNTGNAIIEVTGGSLTVGGQVRRNLNSATGILKYNQTAGTVVIGNRGSISNIRGVFEVLNPGSQFNHSGGSFTLVRGNGSTSVPSLWLEPGSSTITSGSTITIGNGSTPAGTIGIQATAILNNLTLAGTTAGTNTRIFVDPLTVNGNMTVNANNVLQANNINLTIGGNFVVAGTYTPGTNTTIFTNGTTSSISGGATALSFYNFTKSGAGTLSLLKDINITRDLVLSSGVLNTATFAVNLTRHALIDAAITSTSGNGLVFGGTSQQQLSRSTAGVGSLGIISVNNSSGVIIPDGNGYDFNLSTNLRLQSGVLDIGGSLLTLGSSALITAVSPFSSTNMVQTNSSFNDKGLRKIFPTNYVTDFVFPVGQLNYTPVTFKFSGSGNTTGTTGTPTITVRPANERHPSVVNDDGPGELPDPATFNDLNNVLQYYWIINADNVDASFQSTMTLSYVQPLVAVVFAPPGPEYTEADYLAARILADNNPTEFINKFSVTDVNEVTNAITFNFAGVDDLGISGDYFAGVSVAIPDNVPVYTTNSSGLVGDPIYTPAVPGGGAPAGAKIIISTGDQVTFNTNSIKLYETQINAGAKLIIPTNSIGHRLGILSGTGDLEINSNTGSAVLPSADYALFFSCSGGGLIFGGSGAYEILGGIPSLRNLTLNGAGNKSLANNDITICNDFTLNAGAFINTNGKNVIVQNDVLLNGATYTNNNGTLSITRDFTESSGSFSGGTGGLKTIGRNLTVSAGTFTPGSGSTNIIRVNGDMTVAAGATITSGTGGSSGQRFTFGGSGVQTLNGSFTGTRAFNRLEINNSSGLVVAGNTTVASELLLTSGLISPGSNTLLMGASAISTPSEGRSTSFVDGKLYKQLTSGQSFIFPIGKGTRWRTGYVNVVTQTGSFTWDMEYFAAPATGVVANAPAPRSNPVNNFNSNDASILRVAGTEYWRVSDGVGTTGRTAYVGLSWGIESDVSPNLAQRESLKVMSWNGTNWSNNGGTNFLPGGAHTQSRGTFNSTGTVSFSENIVTLGSSEIANPLPIELKWFKGEIVGERGYLYWKTESELNNDYFEIQRSTDGHEFEQLGIVQGNGTTQSAFNYVYEDPTLKIGKNYYRLKQYDFDGKISYSSIVVLDYNGIARLGMFVFPNPTRFDNINFKLEGTTDGDAFVRLFDMTGKVVYKTYVESKNISNEVLIDAGTLKAGMYVIEAIQGKSRVTQRIIVKD